MIAIPEPPIASARVGLRILRNDLNRSILEALDSGPLTAGALCTRLMLESDTSLREQLRTLEDARVVEGCSRSPHGTKSFRLSPAGDEFARVMGLAGAWLTRRPGPALNPESDAAWRAFAALGDAWELSLIQRLLVRPGTRAELTATVPSLNKQKVKRILRRLEGAGLFVISDSADRAPRYLVSEWGRRSIAILSAISRWELAHLPHLARPLVAIEATIGLLAILPLIQRPNELTGVCSFTVQTEVHGPLPRSSAVWARMSAGRISACRIGRCPTRLDAWAFGNVEGWFNAVADGRPAALRVGGDRDLALGMLRGLHEELRA
jgi:DNA-binding HxlR family transcriptional regulator